MGNNRMKRRMVVLALVVLVLISASAFGADEYDTIREYDKTTANKFIIACMLMENWSMLKFILSVAITILSWEILHS